MLGISRRQALTAIATSMFISPFARAMSERSPAEVEQILVNDPDDPTGGNPHGDVTIVAFFDYNCPFCKESAPALDRIVREDGKIRIVYKDWPILAPTSVYGAKLALGAKYQNRYEVAHRALMAIPGYGIPEWRILAAIKATDIDVERLNNDVVIHAADIAALLKRNMAAAQALHLEGTPIYVIGGYIHTNLDYAGFKRAASDARDFADDATSRLVTTSSPNKTDSTPSR